MSLFIASLNSGSNGNCYYVGNQEEAVLVDAGISCRETEKRLSRSGLSIGKIKAIFITHEHTDHIKGLCALVQKHKIPVYFTSTTCARAGLDLPSEQVHFFKAYSPIQIGSLSVTAFPKFHDATDPHSFIISCKEVTVGVFTDIGALCPHVIQNFKQCHAVFLEANYDEHMLETGRYPYSLKNRIRSGRGHISNREALQLFTQHRPPFMSHLLLSHLSHENNDPELVETLFKSVAHNTEIVIASRFKETEVYSISSKQEKTITLLPFIKIPVPNKSRAKQKSTNQLQLSLF